MDHVLVAEYLEDRVQLRRITVETLLSSEAAARSAADAALLERINSMSDRLKLLTVQALPSKSVEYDFSDDVSRFTNAYRTACSISEGGDERCQSITHSGNSNTYRRAYLSCADIMNDATKVLVEFDTRFGDRWQIGLADLDQRPGESTGSDSTAAGVAFCAGTSDGTTLFVNGSRTSASITDIWMHIKAVMDFKTKSTEYIISNRDTGAILSGEIVEFRDPELAGITGIEVYTWSTGHIDIDNIEITSSYDAQDNVIYMVQTENNKYCAYVCT